jgi:hypothetical protein
MAVVGAGVTPMSGMMGGLPFLGSSGNSTESAQG